MICCASSAPTRSHGARSEPFVARCTLHVPGTTTSEQLALGAQAGCSDCFAGLVDRLHDPLYQFLLWRTPSPSDAEELTHESFVRAWRKLAGYRPRWTFATWLFTIARRLAISRGRRLRPAREVAWAEAEPVHSEDPGDALEREELRASIWCLVRDLLSDEQQSALWLRYAEGFSTEDIAAVLGKRPAAVRALLFRAREKLAQRLEPLGTCDDRRVAARVPRGMGDGS